MTKMQDFYYTIMSSLGVKQSFYTLYQSRKAYLQCEHRICPADIFPVHRLLSYLFQHCFTSRRYNGRFVDIKSYTVTGCDDRNIFRNRFPRLYLLQFYRHQNILLRVLGCRVQQAELLIRCHKPFSFLRQPT